MRRAACRSVRAHVTCVGTASSDAHCDALRGSQAPDVTSSTHKKELTMHRSKPWLTVTLLALGLSAPVAVAQKQEPKKADKATVKIVATGGTIAGAGAAGGYGYTSGQFKVEDLIKAVPDLDKLARLSGEQVANIGSQDMNDEVWLKLAKRADQVLDEAGTNGVLITHGTDTLEETAYFLNLVLKTEKPVVMVGSMRPATAISADGPANLYNGVAVATDDGYRGRGVLGVLIDEVHSACNVTKMNTASLETFASPNRGPLGFVHSGKIDWFERMNKRHTGQSEFSVDRLQTLPRVDIIYAHSNMSTDLIQAALDRGAKGIVIAGVGDGNMSKAAIELLAQAVK